MLLLVTPSRIIGDVHFRIERLRSLLHDLESLASGERPSAETLASAPTLDAAMLASREVLCLSGLVRGHPTLRGPVIVTSELVAIAPGDGWARTSSRFYRVADVDLRIPVSSRC